MGHARRLGLLLALLMLGALAQASAAMGEATWQFAPAEAPPAPPGTPQQTLPVPLGKVGAISFWSPNRGLLIDEGTTGGNAGCRTTTATAVPCGLYAYNGRGWHLLSTVCGAGEGRIAWAGPDDFWTISDQRPGQLTKTTVNSRSVSLCHFEGGNVVASYATPFELPNSYRQMDAAACDRQEVGSEPHDSETDCWFGGLLGVPPNTGAFHLHWDGETQKLTAVYSPEDHAVSSMAVDKPGALLESVEINPVAIGDDFSGENEAHPFVLHQIDSSGFHGLLIEDPSCAQLNTCPPLPNYEGVAPSTIAGFSLSSDYSAANPEPQVWAAAGLPPRPQASTHSIVLRYSHGSWTQALDVNHPGTYGSEAEKRAAKADLEAGLQQVAAEPGEPAAWATVVSKDEEAHVDRLTVNGAASASDHTGTIAQKVVLGEAQHAGQRGSAGPIACPTRNDCWLATSKGWLFHLTEEANNPSWAAGYPEDEDPNFANSTRSGFAGVISFRPIDEGVPQLPPNEPPPDTSQANQLPEPLKPPEPTAETPVFSQRALIVGLHSRVVHRYTLELTFKLVADAHVQLIARRHRRPVAQTARRMLKAGKRRLTLRLNPHRWPNELDLKAVPLKPLPPGPAISGGGGGQTKPGPLNANNFST
jgi:hypothetical protein